MLQVTNRAQELDGETQCPILLSNSTSSETASQYYNAVNLSTEETLHDPVIFYIFGRGKLRPRKFCTEARKSTNGS